MVEQSTSASQIHHPEGVAVDLDGNIFVSNSSSSTITVYFGDPIGGTWGAPYISF
jgi:DNA-binding beta-propeller fold protein YncE